MRRALVVAFLAFCALALPLRANEKRQGYCAAQSTGARVTGCVVTVYYTGTTTLANPIYSDSLNTPLANPFQADLVTGLWSFYAPNGHYDVNLQGGAPTISPAYTLSDYLLFDPSAIGATVSLASISSQTVNGAQSGFLRLAPGDCLSWRNNANTLDNCLTENATDQLTYQGNTFVYAALNNVISGSNTFTNSNTHSGTELFANINNSIYADQQAGADACAKIVTAYGKLPTSGGIVNATGFQGLQSSCASTFSVGGLNNTPELLILAGAALQVPNSIVLNGGSSIVGLAANSNGPFPTRLIASAGTFPNNTVLVQFDKVNPTNQSITLSNIELDCAAITGCTGIDVGNAQDLTSIQKVWIANFMANGLISRSASLSENFVIDQVTIIAASTAPSSAIGVVLNATADHYDLRGVNVTGNAGLIAAGIQCNGCDMVSTAMHIEAATDGLQFTGTGGTSDIQEVDCLSTVVNCVHVTSTFTGVLRIGAINTLNASSPISFKIDVAGVTVTCTDKITGNLFLNASVSPPILRTGCSALPNGTGTAVLKKGSGAGNYTTASTTYVVPDSTNLCYTVTIPTGWKLGVQASGSIGTSTAIVAASAALTDNAACSTANAGLLTEAQIDAGAIGGTAGFSLSWVITGDGNAHNVALQIKTANGSDSALLLNSSSTALPTMTFMLTPSN